MWGNLRESSGSWYGSEAGSWKHDNECNIWGSHSITDEYWDLLGCYAMSTCKQLPKSQLHISWCGANTSEELNLHDNEWSHSIKGSKFLEQWSVGLVLKGFVYGVNTVCLCTSFLFIHCQVCGFLTVYTAGCDSGNWQHFLALISTFLHSVMACCSKISVCAHSMKSASQSIIQSIKHTNNATRWYFDNSQFTTLLAPDQRSWVFCYFLAKINSMINSHSCLC